MSGNCKLGKILGSKKSQTTFRKQKKEIERLPTFKQCLFSPFTLNCSPLNAELSNRVLILVERGLEVLKRQTKETKGKGHELSADNAQCEGETSTVSRSSAISDVSNVNWISGIVLGLNAVSRAFQNDTISIALIFVGAIRPRSLLHHLLLLSSVHSIGLALLSVSSAPLAQLLNLTNLTSMAFKKDGPFGETVECLRPYCRVVEVPWLYKLDKGLETISQRPFPFCTAKSAAVANKRHPCSQPDLKMHKY